MLLTELVIADLVHRLAQRGRIVAAVVLPPGGRLVRELVGRDEVLEAERGGIHPQLERQTIDHTLDGMHRLGDAEGAAVGDAAGGFVGVDTINRDVRSLQRVGAGADTEQSGGELRGVGGGIEGAMIGDRLDP